MPDDPQEFNEEEVKRLLMDGLKSRKLNGSSPKSPNVDENIKTILGEFMDCYKLIGYDLNGRAVSITKYENRLEKDALDHSFMEEFAKRMGM